MNKHDGGKDKQKIYFIFIRTMNHLLLFLKGMAMGAADVVPGVSGGTIAFITGIYDKLLGSISNISFSLLGLLKKEGFLAVWRKVNGTFLITLFSGIFTSILSLSKLLSHLLEAYPVLIWSFFFGLIIASIIYVGRMIKSWGVKEVIGLILGTVLIVAISLLPTFESSSNLIYLFICGAIAICAMILPGISGSFLLLILGVYQAVLGAVSEFKLDVIAVFGAGALVGLLSFSRLLKWVLEKYRNTTMSVLTGFLLGSLYKIWPWKETTEFRVNSHGEQVPYIQENIVPQGDWFYALIFTILGFILLFGIEMVGQKLKKTN